MSDEPPNAEEPGHETLAEELLALVDEGRAMARAEIAYQSARDDSDAYKSPQPANLWGRRSIPLICGT